MNRLDDLMRFYDALSVLESRLGGKRRLAEFSSYKDWPTRGVYFFFEPGEDRTESGAGPRVVRVGTHALAAGSRSTLRQRLRQHRGTSSGRGNHRGSIFRLLVGQALVARGDIQQCVSWGIKGDLGAAAKTLGTDRKHLRDTEQSIEEAVSRYIGAMPFLWIDIGDDPSPDSLRGYVERNAIALLSNQDRPQLDVASESWLGRASDRNRVLASGLWNQRHVDEMHDKNFVETFSQLCVQTGW